MHRFVLYCKWQSKWRWLKQTPIMLQGERGWLLHVPHNPLLKRHAASWVLSPVTSLMQGKQAHTSSMQGKHTHMHPALTVLLLAGRSSF